ncbi:hypothetical protein N7451_012327 [Penicillium sp. IBT 35674x]|nr:hypothetical protein N7451_012327 [Penicillium sp. IBT 35674x]
MSGIRKRARSDKSRDHHSQAQMFHNSMSEHEKAHMIKALIFELDHCDVPMVYERLAGTRLPEIDLKLAQQAAELVGAPIPEKQLMSTRGYGAKGLSQAEFSSEKPTIESRRIAIIIGDRYDRITFEGMKMAIKVEGALPFVIGTKSSPIYAEGQSSGNVDGVVAGHMYDGQRSTMFDATVILSGSHISILSKNGQIRLWVVESFGHLKSCRSYWRSLLSV